VTLPRCYCPSDALPAADALALANTTEAIRRWRAEQTRP
jgi:hypothetical protein